MLLIRGIFRNRNRDSLAQTFQDLQIIMKSHFLLCSCSILVMHLMFSPALAMDGNYWRQLNSAAKSTYIIAVLDVLKDVSYFSKNLLECPDGSKELFGMAFSRPLRCVQTQKMPFSQIEAIVSKYIEAHPEAWHHTLSSLVWARSLDKARHQI